jgi:hypothetical protein
VKSTELSILLVWKCYTFHMVFVFFYSITQSDGYVGKVSKKLFGNFCLNIS